MVYYSTGDIMKLMDCPQNTWVRVVQNDNVPIASPPIIEDELIWFGHLDGMYSYCKNTNGNVVHLQAWAEVYVDEDAIDMPVPRTPKEDTQ